MLKSFILILLMFAATGCSTLTVDRRAELDQEAVGTINKLAENNPGLEQKLSDALGYVFLGCRTMKIIPWIGWGSAKGFVVDNAIGKRTYIKASRWDVGGGYGIRDYDVMIVLYDPKLMKKAYTGKWSFGAGAEATAGTASVEGSSSQLELNKKYELFTLSERGASVTWTVNAIHFKPYKD
ncbi:hypothetical protein PDESU_05234 [Pontiella desulfatans]|uniref:Ysc84 actin-binding domain-containing protein n=1 Tax=Pontiella desulfatans TaxID=2750659 RepID=A0A6C2U9V9_PONDE|nr:hypothetical protein [Pontiella desulfatans]VGO16643.1 hypothetical protein PDESU_05234 [Pontiella desulfatans]